MTCSVCRSFNSISLRHYSLEYCKCRRSSVHVPFNLKCLSSTTIEHWRSKVMNPQISFDNLRSSIFEFRLRACVLLYFWHDLLVPKTLEAHLTSFTKNKEIGSTSASFREGPKMSKRQNSISCRTFQGPFDLQTTLESGLQL